MANIVINASLSKYYKDKASGIATALRGKSIIGFMDVRNVEYKDKSKHIAGLRYDKNARMFFLTSPKKADNINIGVFISTYEISVKRGKILAKEDLTDVYELPSVGAKLERGGYAKEQAKAKGIAEVFPKKTRLFIYVLSSKDKIVINNSEGFVFTCDFKVGKWYTMRPGTKTSTIYNMRIQDQEAANIFKSALPFPALDRNLYKKTSDLEQQTFDLNKHVLAEV